MTLSTGRGTLTFPVNASGEKRTAPPSWLVFPLNFSGENFSAPVAVIAVPPPGFTLVTVVLFPVPLDCPTTTCAISTVISIVYVCVHKVVQVTPSGEPAQVRVPPDSLIFQYAWFVELYVVVPTLVTVPSP